MKLNYNMDISNKSESFNHTPSLQAQKLPFYVHSGGYMCAGENYYTEREGLDNYLLMYTLSGCGTMNFRGREYRIPPEHAVLIYCKEYQLYKTVSGLDWEFRWCHLGGQCINEYFQLINGDTLNVINMQEHQDINQLLKNIFIWSQNKDMLLDIKTCAVITDILSKMIVSKHNILNNKKYHQHREEIDYVVQYIHDNYDKHITIDDIMKHVHMSKYYFIRLFKAYTSMSPYEYLLNYRINMSKSLLQETNLNINEIVYNIGFGDTNNYIRSFKKLVGTTPSKYRKYWDREYV